MGEQGPTVQHGACDKPEGKRMQKKNIYVCVELSHSAVQHKLIQCCKSTKLQFLKKKSLFYFCGHAADTGLLCRNPGQPQQVGRGWQTQGPANRTRRCQHPPSLTPAAAQTSTARMAQIRALNSCPGHRLAMRSCEKQNMPPENILLSRSAQQAASC